MRSPVILLSVLVITTAAWTAASTVSMSPEQSVLTVRVFKSGLFSAFGHEHEVSAPIQKGSFTEQSPAVELSVDARRLRVMDQDVSDKDRAEIQQTMLGPKVLDSERFPEIRFHSTSIEAAGDGKWVVRGELTLHGETRPIKFEVARQNGHYRGSAELRQKDFGIAPVTVAGGTVKVKNELRVEFDIVGDGKPGLASAPNQR